MIKLNYFSHFSVIFYQIQSFDFWLVVFLFPSSIFAKFLDQLQFDARGVRDRPDAPSPPPLDLGPTGELSSETLLIRFVVWIAETASAPRRHRSAPS